MNDMEKENPIAHGELKTNRTDEDKKTFDEIYHQSIVTANNKAHNLEQWEDNPSSFLMKEFLYEYKNDIVATFDFKVENKSYIEKHEIEKDRNGELKSILEDFSKNSNKKNSFNYSSDLSKELFSIFIDYLNKINLELSIIGKPTKVQTKFSSRLKNFERDLLIGKYPKQKDDIDNFELRDLVFASSEVMYALSSRHLFILTYTPTNEQYYNDKIKESNKAPVFSFIIYEREVEEHFIENYVEINLLHNSFMQFIYASDINQNVANAMGEASLISQHWYTKSVNRILNDHKVELSKAKDSYLLSEYIMRYLLAANIDNVNLVEVYPFDRAFMFNHAIDFSIKNDKRDPAYRVAEGLIESKITNSEIKEKAFLAGKTRYAYEWERIKTGLGFEKFNPSKKKLKFIKTTINKQIDDSEDTLIKPIDKDIDTVINNIVHTIVSPNQDENMLLEYQSKYVNNNIVYLYTSGTNLKTQLPAIYKLQKEYLESISIDKNDGIRTEINFEETYKKNIIFDNTKVVLFSYIPDEDDAIKGFTFLLVANQDVPKALMEQKAEKDDLHTALKLLVNQHFTIDAEYKQKAKNEQKELVDILRQTEHTLKNSFDIFLDENNFDKTNIEKFKSKVLGIIEQDRIQMEDFGREVQTKKFKKSGDNPLSNSLNFLQATLSNERSSNDSKEEDTVVELNKKFEIEPCVMPWDHFANEIYNLKISELQSNRIQEFKWKNPNNVKEYLKLRIDFNELQDFILEYKESLFNDAIYVMLKNCCEHTLETMENEGKEIFLDIYISVHGEEESLNIEFTNDTQSLCKEMFDHINRGTVIKNNKDKENSSGIGVVTLRKRLDVTYGLDKSNINFTMVGKNKIKSRLYVPIKILDNSKNFKTEYECLDDTNILYLEDSLEIYKMNIKVLDTYAVKCHHERGHSEENMYKNYDLLLTDLNIYGNDSNIAKKTYGEDAIYEFTKENSNGIVIVLSTDEFSMEDLNGYKIEKNISKLSVLDKGTVYLTNLKHLSENKKLLKLIVEVYQQKDTLSQTSEDLKGKKYEGRPLAMNNYRNRKSFSKSFKLLSNLKSLNDTNNINEQGEINNNLFMFDGSNIAEAIKLWEHNKVKRKSGSPQSLSNSEIPEQFLTRLIIKVEESEYLSSAILKHEGLRRNILFVNKDINDKEILNMANLSTQYEMPKKGIFSKISHDIIGKMKEFSGYSNQSIEYLGNKNQMLRDQFEKSFNAFLITDLPNDIENIEKEFSSFVMEIERLQKDAKKENNYLGSSLSNIYSSLLTLKYLLSGVK